MQTWKWDQGQRVFEVERSPGSWRGAVKGESDWKRGGRATWPQAMEGLAGQCQHSIFALIVLGGREVT